MSVSAERTILEVTRDLLNYGGDVRQYETNLSSLSRLVSSTGTDSVMRDALVDDPSFLKLCTDTLPIILLFPFQSESEKDLYIRTVRGLVLLVRNLSVSNSAQPKIADVISSMRVFITHTDQTHLYFAVSLQAYLQAFANIFTKETIRSACDFPTISEIVDASTIAFITKTDIPDMKLPLNIVLSHLLQNQAREAMETQIRDNCFLINYIVEQGCYQLDYSEFTPDLLPLLQIIITRESFRAWLCQQKTGREKILKVCQLVVTSKEDWNDQEAAVIIQWGFDTCRQFANESIDLLTSSQHKEAQLATVHALLVRSLDIISDISKFEVAQHFLRNNSATELFIHLLRVVHENTEILTHKTKDSQKNNSSDSIQQSNKKLPMVKSLIIEIITFMCHDSNAIKDEIRTLHGLELILSSCVIDEHNPYMKEHAILCLKFLLQDNAKNQEFVAQLEAKQVIDGSALSDAGYEITIADGNVKLKHKPRE